MECFPCEKNDLLFPIFLMGLGRPASVSAPSFFNVLWRSAFFPFHLKEWLAPLLVKQLNFFQRVTSFTCHEFLSHFTMNIDLLIIQPPFFLVVLTLPFHTFKDLTAVIINCSPLSCEKFFLFFSPGNALFFFSPFGISFPAHLNSISFLREWSASL